MKKELGPGAVVAAVVVVVLLLVGIAWRYFSLPAPPADSPEARAAAHRVIEGFKSQARQQRGGALPTSSASAGK